MNIELVSLLVLQATFRVFAVGLIAFLLFWVFLKRDLIFRRGLVDQPSTDEPRLPRSLIVAVGKPIRIAPPLRVIRGDVR